MIGIIVPINNGDKICTFLIIIFTIKVQRQQKYRVVEFELPTSHLKNVVLRCATKGFYFRKTYRSVVQLKELNSVKLKEHAIKIIVSQN